MLRLQQAHINLACSVSFALYRLVTWVTVSPSDKMA